MVGGSGAVNVTSINLVGSSQKKVQSTDDILRQIESTLPDSGHEDKFRQEELSSRILGRISQHEAAFGDKHLPRQRLPKVDAVLLDRYQAARRNVLVLGAIQQASRPNTHRSGKSSSARSVTAAASGDTASLDGDGSSTVAAGIDSTFTSFNGSGTDGAHPANGDGDMSAEPSGIASIAGSRVMNSSSRRLGMSRHCNNSTRSAASSFAGSSVISSSRLRQQGSSISTGSGRTLRSEGTSVSKYSHHIHHGKKTPRRHKAPKRKPGRVTTALAEYGSRDDWMSRTLLKHYLASVIQARWRGYQVRKRWAQGLEGRQQLVEEEKERLQQPEQHQQHLRELQRKLLARQQKLIAQASAAAVAAAALSDGNGDGGEANSSSKPGPATAGALGPAAAGRIGVVAGDAARAASAGIRVPGSRVISAAAGGRSKLKAWQTVKFAGGSEAYPPPDALDSDSDSGWSDIELEDVASIKFRAVTPPWQKAGEHCHMSKQLRQRTAAAAAAATGKALPPDTAGFGPLGAEMGGLLGVLWDDSNNECNARLQELRHRRICRKPEPVPLSEPAVAAAAASGLLTAPQPGAEGTTAIAAIAATGALDTAADPQGSPLPTQAVEQLLLGRYNAKYSRMGVPERMPGRGKWLKLQEAAKAAAGATAGVLSSSAAAAAAEAVVGGGLAGNAAGAGSR